MELKLDYDDLDNGIKVPFIWFEHLKEGYYSIYLNNISAEFILFIFYLMAYKKSATSLKLVTNIDKILLKERYNIIYN